MTPDQALSILDQATQPHAKLNRQDYVMVQQALLVLAEAIKTPEPIDIPVEA